MSNGKRWLIENVFTGVKSRDGTPSTEWLAAYGSEEADLAWTEDCGEAFAMTKEKAELRVKVVQKYFPNAKVVEL